MRIDRNLLHTEPFRSIVEHAIEMAQAIAMHTGKRGLTRISITPDLGLMLGLEPSTSIDISTPPGLVELYVEAYPRLSGRFTMEPYTP